MIPIWLVKYQNIDQVIAERFSEIGVEDGKKRLVGFIFAPEHHEITQKTLRPNIHIYDGRSGNDFDLYWVGWRKYEAYHPLVSGQSRFSFRFFEENYLQICKEIEDNTRWRWSGGVDLLLFSAYKVSHGSAIIDISSAIDIKLTTAVASKDMLSLDIFLESIFRFCRDYDGDDPVKAFSSERISEKGIGAIQQGLLGLFPKECKNFLRSISYLSPRDLRQEKSAWALFSTKTKWHGSGKAY